MELGEHLILPPLVLLHLAPALQLLQHWRENRAAAAAGVHVASDMY